jgi:hypothetical protein
MRDKVEMTAIKKMANPMTDPAIPYRRYTDLS